MPKEKYTQLRANPEIIRWYREVKRGSQTTADVYLRRLGAFCNSMDKDPGKLIKMKDRQLADLISDYVSEMEDKGRAGGYISSTVKAVKSWLSFNGIKIPRRIKINGANDTPTLDDKGIFSPEDLKKVLDSADVRGRMAISMVAFSGIRLQSLGNEHGTDGLMLSDIEGLVIDRYGIRFEEVPAKVTVRKTISKKGHEYFTFIGREGCDYIVLYLNERLRSGEELTGESALLTRTKFNLRKDKKFITRTKVSELIRSAIRTAGFDNRPYDLRPYFASRLLRAQDDRLITRDYRTFFMGHKGDIEHTYTTERILPKDMVEAMREAYARSFKYLQSRVPVTEEEKETLEKGLTFLVLRKYFNFTDSEINDLVDLPDEELQKKIQEKIGVSEDKGKIKQKAISDREEVEHRTNGARQKIIPLSHVEVYIDEGFEFVKDLSDDKAIMRLP